LRKWDAIAVSAAFSRRTHGETPQRAGPFLESFLSGGAELLLQDLPLLNLVDAWLCDLREDDFVEMLPLLRRSFSEFDPVARRRLLAQLGRDRHSSTPVSSAHPAGESSDEAFAQALPLLCKILGIEMPTSEVA
jgi:hypothetical protein